MGVEITEIVEYGEAMSALTQLQRNFVNQWLDHANWSGTALAEAAGYATGPPGSNTLTTTAYRLTHDPKVLAAMDEEASKRMRSGGAIGVAAVVKIALNESHKDHMKAALALMNRTGRHETTEHHVIVDDKRPQTKAELIAAVRRVASEAGLTPAEAEKLIGSSGEVVEVEFEEIIRVEDL
jgi:hypothetical protein